MSSEASPSPSPPRALSVPQIFSLTPQPLTPACTECRGKKRKCDRGQPCAQCKKSGREQFCTFPAPKQPRSDDAIEDTRRVRRRMMSQMGGAGDGITMNLPARSMNEHGSMDDPGRINIIRPIARDAAIPESFVPVMGRVVSKDSTSRYHGPGDKMAMLDRFPDARDFLNNKDADFNITALMKQGQELQKSFLIRKAGSDVPQPTAHASIYEELRDTVVNQNLYPSLTKYFEKHEALFRILHKQSFFAELHNFKARPSETDQSVAKFNLMCQMLLIHIIASSPEIDFVWGVSTSRLVQKWLGTLHGTHKLQLDLLKTQTLLLMARQSLSVPAEELWKEAGTLVRSAMVLGLHFQGSTQFPLFEREQRRKLWLTILELDLQFSLECGMPPSLPYLHEVVEPANLNDSDLLDEDLDDIASAHPLEYTNALPQITLAKSLRVRIEAANLLSLSTKVKTPEYYLNVAKSLEEYIKQIPPCLKVAAGDRAHPFTQIGLDMILRRTLQAALWPVIAGDIRNEIGEASLQILNSSMVVSSHLDSLDPEYAASDAIASKEFWHQFHILFKQEIVQAIMVLCMKIQSFNAEPSHNMQNPQSAPSPPAFLTRANLIRTVESVMKGLIDRIGLAHSNLKDVLMLSVVFQCVRTNGGVEQKRELMMKGAQRVLEAHRGLEVKKTPVVKVQPEGSDTLFTGTDHVENGSLEVQDDLLDGEFCDFDELDFTQWGTSTPTPEDQTPEHISS